MQTTNIYNDTFVKDLFNEMSKTYGIVNYITSLGFSERWRRQCVKKLSIPKGAIVYDLMTGMGECWPYVLNKIGDSGTLVAVDFSDEMIKQAKSKKRKKDLSNVCIIKENILNNSIPDNSADYMVSGFGLKTFTEEQLSALAYEVKRILKPNGQFSFIEISKPENRILKLLYLFYLKQLIPILGKLFLGNPENYRMLGVYTENFKNCSNVKRIFQEAGLEVNYSCYFYSCATGITGKKV